MMRNAKSAAWGFVGALALTTAMSSSVWAGSRPVVIELFTSQGCSSCPPANANLIELSKDPNVLTLSFAVTYWDYLGWKDSFGREEFTQRQVIYEPALGKSGPFTPQMVINGQTSVIGHDLQEVEQLVATTARLDGPSISLGKSTVAIGKMASVAEKADVWLVRYDPDLVEVPIGRGENTGETLPHIHVVHSLERLGEWAGPATSFTLHSTAAKLKTAILVQRKNGGSILSAATD